MLNNHQFNMMPNNQMNNPFNSNVMFNNQFNNNFNPMNNQMNLNNNKFNNPSCNNMMMNNQNMFNNKNMLNNQMMFNNQKMIMNQNMFNNQNKMMNPNCMMNGNMQMNQNLMMNLNIQMNQNMMMYNMIQNNNKKIMLMKNLLYQKNLQNQMNQILNKYDNQTNNNINNIVEEFKEEETEEERKEREALTDVVKEQLTQQQNFDNLQPPQNLNYDEVDPEFIDSFISDKELFCGRGHNLTGKWAHGESRGGRPYNPPDGWIGFGLNVINKYDNGNNDWLTCDGRPGEWCVAFHGACVRNTSDQIKQIIKPILQQNLKPGAGQACSGYNDACHPGHKVGIGVYCTPNPTDAEGYAGKIDVNGFKYKVAFMLRVKPDKIRYGAECPNYWVLNAGNGDFSEMRPYRFLIKKC